jgi:hypothetical protein
VNGQSCCNKVHHVRLVAGETYQAAAKDLTTIIGFTI